MRNNPWTPEKTQKLAKMWEAGATAAVIAAALQMTRSAVVGRAHRCGLSARESPIKRSEPGAPPKPRLLALPRRSYGSGGTHSATGGSMQGPTLVLLGVMDAPPPAPRERTPTVRTKPGVCCFPMWETGTRPTRATGWPFCEDVTEPGRSYCPAHDAIAWSAAGQGDVFTASPVPRLSIATKWK